MTKNNRLDRKKDSVLSKKQKAVLQYIDETLESIERIDSHLDLIVLSGYYNYKHLRRKLGRLKVDEEFVPDERQPSYTQKAIRNFEDGISVNCFYNPKAPFLPFCLLEIHQRNSPPQGILKKFLRRLVKDFPGLKVSKVEYGNDIHCKDSDAVGDLHWLLKRYLYIPYQRTIGDKTETKDDKNEKISSGKNYGRQNFVLRLGHFNRPAEALLVLNFDIIKQGGIVDQILLSRALYMQPGRAGDRARNTIDAKRILIEVTDTGFGKDWDELLLKHLVKDYRAKGLPKHQAKVAAKEFVEEWRKFGRSRIWGQKT